MEDSPFKNNYTSLKNNNENRSDLNFEKDLIDYDEMVQDTFKKYSNIKINKEFYQNVKECIQNKEKSKYLKQI